MVVVESYGFLVNHVFYASAKVVNYFGLSKKNRILVRFFGVEAGDTWRMNAER